MSCIRALCRSITYSLPLAIRQNNARFFSACCRVVAGGGLQINPLIGLTSILQTPPLLSAPSILAVPVAGMKIKGRLRKRCRHCFFIMIDERLHVWCDVHPRHKQMQLIQRPQTYVITTHATQGKIRPW